MNTINRTILAVLFLLSTLSPLCNAVDIGDTAPNWILQNGSGEEVDYYQDASEKVSVLIYWATWCPYCSSLMPYLQEAADEYKDTDVVFYAMNIIEDSDPVQHLKDREFTFDLILNADVTMDGYGVRGTPGVFVVDSSHNVVYRRIPDTPDEEVKKAVIDAIKASLN